MSVHAPRFLLVHGWGFDAGLWDGVRAELADDAVDVVDLGFFGQPRDPVPPLGRPVIAVGHSYGLLWLLTRAAVPPVGLIAVNGFPRFTETEDFRPATPKRVLDRMIARFDGDPQGTVDAFRQRCGAGDAGAAVDAGSAGEALRNLRDGDGRAALARLDIPMLALAGGQDPIVEAATSRHAFATHPRLELVWHEDGGHLLPLTAPRWCADHLAGFKARLMVPA